MKTTLWLFLVLASVVTALSREFPLARITPSKTEAFVVDPTKAFHFEFGRGSGLSGLDTIAFDLDGVVQIYQQRREGSWQTGTLKLDPDSIQRIFDTIKNEDIMKMPAVYHADVLDGTQWVLWLTQGAHSKAIYFNNYFPAEIRRLAKLLDAELESAGLPNVRWKQVARAESGLHQKALWNSIK